MSHITPSVDYAQEEKAAAQRGVSSHYPQGKVINSQSKKTMLFKLWID